MMDNATLQIKDNMLVDLAYTITVENQDAAPTEAARIESKPMTKQFVQGGKGGVRGLEQALYGMAVGEEKEIVVSAAEGYGEIDPRAVKTLSRQSVPLAAQAKPGERVRLLHKRSGTVQNAVVVEVQPEKVVLDFNHPLAGKTLHYRVRVDGVRPATAEELEASQATR
jgi:FKBP-type peptidyl-prolyl cis-trans isomerase SlyD